MIKCNVCNVEKEDKFFQTYWHSTQQKMRTRKQCTECLYQIRLKRKNPDKFYENNPNYNKCNTCNEWKTNDNYYHFKNKPVHNTCKDCSRIKERAKRQEELQENCGSGFVFAEPNKYPDEYQKACVFDNMKLLGYLFDEETGIWVKPGVKEIIDGKIVFFKLKGKKFRNSKHLSNDTKQKIKELKNKGWATDRIAIHLNISDTTVYKYAK